MTGKAHTAKRWTPRIMKFYDVLKRGAWISTWQLMMATESPNVSTTISEMWRMGFYIQHRQVGQVHEYRYIGKKGGTLWDNEPVK